MQRTGQRFTATRAMAALSKGLPLITIGQRIPAKLMKPGVFLLTRGLRHARVLAGLFPQ
jgi:hypothetical protein